MMNEILGIVGVFLPIGIVILIVILILATGYVKASPDTAYIISRSTLRRPVRCRRRIISISVWMRLSMSRSVITRNVLRWRRRIS